VSVEAEITDVYTYPDGSALVELGHVATVRIRQVPPKFAEAVVGTTVYGKDGLLIVGGRTWAKQVRGKDMYSLVRPDRI
jgi:hypothetical protein